MLRQLLALGFIFLLLPVLPCLTTDSGRLLGVCLAKVLAIVVAAAIENVVAVTRINGTSGSTWQ